MPSPTRSLFVGLDSFDSALAARFTREGSLPNLAGLLARAAVAESRAPVGLFVSSMWPTMFTAVGADRHGYHCWDEYRPGTYDYRTTTPDEINATPFWTRLSDAGKRVALVDVPHMRARPLNGVHLVEWGCHDRHFGPHSYPPTLIDELKTRHGEHPVGSAPATQWDQFAPCDYANRAGSHRCLDEEVALLDSLLVGADNKERVSLDLLDRGGWDLFMTVLGESHCVGHQLWHASDPKHPRHDPLRESALHDPVRRIYERLDATLGEHLARADASTNVIVYLSHGMAPHYDGTHLLGPLLRRLEQHADGESPVGAGTRTARRLTSLFPDGMRRSILGLASAGVRRRLGAAPPAEPAPGEDGTPAPDRLWFVAPNNTVTGGIRLNLAGREPQGRVYAGDYRAACEWLRGSLLDVINLDSGKPCALDVKITDDYYNRSHLDSLPDLLVEWDHTAPIERVWSPLTGTVVREYTHWRTGDHTPNGLLLVAGPGVKAGKRPVVDTVDIAPTIAATLGVELPDVDGRPRCDLMAGEETLVSIPKPKVAPKPVPWRRHLDERSPGLDRVARGASALRDQVDGLSTAHHLTRRMVEHAHDRADALEERIHQLEEEVAASRSTAAALSSLTDHFDSLREHLADTDARFGGLAEEVADLQRLREIIATTKWLRDADLTAPVMISVITPTRNRVQLLRRAIASVVEQSYRNWELIVVDDGSTDATPSYLATIDDPRVETLRTGGVGCTSARNKALDHARGDVIAYLDDDNRFDPDWLKALAWTFGRSPDVSVAYGARLIDDFNRVHGEPAGGLPWIHYVPWDRASAEAFNIVDMNVLAHRRNGIRFDEQLDNYGDWDLLLKLTDHTTPVAIPVIGAIYSTTAPDRLSDNIGEDDSIRQAERIYEATRARVRMNDS